MRKDKGTKEIQGLWLKMAVMWLAWLGVVIYLIIVIVKEISNKPIVVPDGQTQVGQQLKIDKIKQLEQDFLGR